MGTCSEPAMLQVSNSQGSRTSSNSGLARVLSATHAASCAGVICFIRVGSKTAGSKTEARGLLGVDERRDHSLEQRRGAEGAGRRAEDEARRHGGALPDHREQPAADRELVE